MHRLVLLGDGLLGVAHAVATLGGGELLAKVLVLVVEPLEFGLDLIEELVDLPHVVALPQADGREALIAHVLGCQRHDLTSGSQDSTT